MFSHLGFSHRRKKALPLLPIGTHARKSPSFGGEFSTAERVASCLQSCSDIRTLRKRHACVLTHGLNNRIRLTSKLLNRYADIGCLSESRWAFDRIVNQDIALWNSAIVGYFRARNLAVVLWLYLNLKLRGIGVDSSSVTFSLKSCTELGDVKFGSGIHVDAIKAGLHAGKFVGSSLVGFYSRCGNSDEPHQAFEEILDKLEIC